MPSTILVAMSGGVDSSVAAARLVQEGQHVIGVTLHLWDYPDDGSVRGRCCAPDDLHDAARVASKLGIRHYTLDRRELFQRAVVDPFVQAYTEGKTPSPCVSCNRGVKIAQLLQIADDLGADSVATGHYARLNKDSDPVRLLRARDAAKDQSYFLHMLSPATLRRLVFPLGDATKAEVREQAAALDLPGAEKPESQELCFVPSGRYDEFVAQRAPSKLRPGPIVDDRGNVVGQHRGIHRFTVGQRRNLGVAVGKRSYVVNVDPDTSTIRLGDREQLLSTSATVDSAALAPDVTLPVRCQVAVRYRAKAVPAWVRSRGERGIQIDFEEPVAAVVPGQVAVLYQEDRVLGGGTLSSARALAGAAEVSA